MRSFSVAVATAALVLSAPVAAHAATATIEDPAGDGAQGPKLDVTSATLANKPKAIVVSVKVEKVTTGHVLVYLKPKGHKRFTAFSDYDAKEGTIENGLIKGGSVSVPCSKINTTWSTSDNTIRMRIPANCIDDGDYDAVRFKLLTERATGGDNDFAPQVGDGKWTWSAFADRG